MVGIKDGGYNQWNNAQLWLAFNLPWVINEFYIYSTQTLSSNRDKKKVTKWIAKHKWKWRHRFSSSGMMVKSDRTRFCFESLYPGRTGRDESVLRKSCLTRASTHYSVCSQLSLFLDISILVKLFSYNLKTDSYSFTKHIVAFVIIIFPRLFFQKKRAKFRCCLHKTQKPMGVLQLWKRQRNTTILCCFWKKIRLWNVNRNLNS